MPFWETCVWGVGFGHPEVEEHGVLDCDVSVEEENDHLCIQDDHGCREQDDGKARENLYVCKARENNLCCNHRDEEETWIDDCLCDKET